MARNIDQSCTGLFHKKDVIDTRKIQITGKSTFIVTLPKKWVMNSKLGAGAEVGFSYQDDGSVLLIPPGFRKEHLAKKISADRNIENIERDIRALYVLGNYHTIEIQGTEITTDKKERIKNLCKQLIGFEIVESSFSRIVLQNLLNTGDFTIEKASKRMFSLVVLMFDDLINVLNDNDTVLCKELASRALEIDRTYFLVSRMYTEKMNVKSFSLKDDLTLAQAFYYRLAAENIDRIGDLITKIALYFDNQKTTWDIADSMTELCSTLRNMFRDSFESIKLVDSELANNIITHGIELDLMIEASREASDLIANSRMETVLESCSRVRDHILKIAKISIELSHL
ncbi:PhoU domain-containing protein [Methanolobus psychrotolerans]|uniref:PhoU domain-containing protein n=1 Tax=Methanolobus psychrotolerans TaxID=1874706 RepID=UPI000B91C601|nr:phosphate uptake regulator PhoU [Methanolobus psychrotolerans]